VLIEDAAPADEVPEAQRNPSQGAKAKRNTKRQEALAWLLFVSVRFFCETNPPRLFLLKQGKGWW
jgi:hypothetical protein